MTKKATSKAEKTAKTQRAEEIEGYKTGLIDYILKQTIMAASTNKINNTDDPVFSSCHIQIQDATDHEIAKIINGVKAHLKAEGLTAKAVVITQIVIEAGNEKGIELAKKQQDSAVEAAKKQGLKKVE